ncbi:hypothetical protein K461DRAFT_272583 [Myriangium duriaei CBS 260.36]|uniref:Uncharacterized protein n=1 Tax=Myriangium duriaei CBS 260.36 TaxID=1168546 RepID=A0A9P4ITS3_9PEZI|nr:hypothetical protein K461DRAFT_272583 [Myriangium duriaei CBS 260.36]
MSVLKALFNKLHPDYFDAQKIVEWNIRMKATCKTMVDTETVGYNATLGDKASDLLVSPAARATDKYIKPNAASPSEGHELILFKKDTLELTRDVFKLVAEYMDANKEHGGSAWHFKYHHKDARNIIVFVDMILVQSSDSN